MAINVSWENYFSDLNVSFPKYPSIIEGISVYDAPYGMGVQFRGGPQQLVLQGKSSSVIYEFLNREMDGKNHIDIILLKIPEGLDFIEVTDVLRILHANGLLKNNLTIKSDKHEFGDYLTFQQKQLDFYRRVLGRTGFNEDVEDVTYSLKNIKVLLIGSGAYGDTVAGLLRTIGYELVTHFSFDKGLQDANDQSTNYHYLDRNGADQVLQKIYENINDYTFLITALENPSYGFIMGLNRLCLNSNKNIIFSAITQNLLRIGPYVSPKRSPCYQCFQMRMDSYQDNAVTENIYQDSLSERNVVFDEALKGEDLISNLLGATYLASELNKIASGIAVSSLVNNVIEYDILDGKFSYSNTLRVPFCPECSH